MTIREIGKGSGKVCATLRIGESIEIDGIEIIVVESWSSKARLLIVDPKQRFARIVKRMTEDQAMNRVPVSVEADRRQCT